MTTSLFGSCAAVGWAPRPSERAGGALEASGDDVDEDELEVEQEELEADVEELEADVEELKADEELWDADDAAEVDAEADEEEAAEADAAGTRPEGGGRPLAVMPPGGRDMRNVGAGGPPRAPGERNDGLTAWSAVVEAAAPEASARDPAAAPAAGAAAPAAEAGRGPPEAVLARLDVAWPSSSDSGSGARARARGSGSWSRTRKSVTEAGANAWWMSIGTSSSSSELDKSAACMPHQSQRTASGLRSRTSYAALHIVAANTKRDS